MELSQLQYFVAVSQCGKIRTAAEMLNISQSGISMAIARLEAELGVALIEKQGRNICLTRAGRTFASLVAPALASLENARREIIARKNAYPPIITISTEDAVYCNRLRKKYLQTTRSGVLFQQSFDKKLLAQNKLISGAVDFAFTYEPQDTPNIVSFKILDEPAMVQLPAADPLAQEARVRLSDLKNRGFVAFPEGYGVRDWFDAICTRAGFRAEIRHETEDVIGLSSITWVLSVCALIGWSSQEPEENPLARAIPLAEPFCRKNIYVSYLRSRRLSPEAEEFLTFLRQCAEFSFHTGILPEPYDWVTGVVWLDRGDTDGKAEEE